MRLHDRARDREPRAAARPPRPRAAAEEGLELEALARHLHRHRDRPVRRRVADRVPDQVEQHPLQLLGVR
jgi:hypothetical protein